MSDESFWWLAGAGLLVALAKVAWLYLTVKDKPVVGGKNPPGDAGG